MSNNLFNYFKRESSLPCPSGPASKTVLSALIQAAKDSVLSIISNVVMVRNAALTLSCRQKIKRFPSKRRMCT